MVSCWQCNDLGGKKWEQYLLCGFLWLSHVVKCNHSEITQIFAFTVMSVQCQHKILNLQELFTLHVLTQILMFTDDVMMSFPLIGSRNAKYITKSYFSTVLFLLKPDYLFFLLTFVFACGGSSSRPASLCFPPSALPSLGARLNWSGVALVQIGADLLGQERVDWMHRYRLPLVERTQHVAWDQQRK